MKLVKQLPSLILFFMMVASIQAKWAPIDDAPIKTRYYQEIKIDESGIIRESGEICIEILNEAGRALVAHYVLKYNESSEKVKILEAKTIYRGKEYKLTKNLIEDKVIASTSRGSNDVREVLFSFPKPEIGAKVWIKYEHVTHKVFLAKAYDWVFNFGHKELMAERKIKLRSLIPLYISVNDPEKVLEVKEAKLGKFYDLEINLVKPLYKQVVNESPIGFVNMKHLTWVLVSSTKNWEDLAIKVGKFYVKIFTQPLPNSFKEIVDLTSKQKEDVDKIEMLTALLNERIKYRGDWRTVAGKFIPHDLDEISNTQAGDCKEFVAITAALLTKIGYKAQIALIRSGELDHYPETLPSLRAFNHAIVKVISKQGKIYWIDPVNLQSMARGISPNIAGKKALVIDVKHPSYEKIPDIDPKRAQAIFKREIEILAPNVIIETGNITFKNEKAYELTGATLWQSEETLKDNLYNLLSNTILEEKNKKMMRLPDLKSRIVRDISIDYIFEQKNKMLKTNVGHALKLDYNLLDVFFNISPDWVSDVVVGVPFSGERQTIVKNVKVQNASALDKEIKTPWLYVVRKCRNKVNDFQIDEKIIVYQGLIPNEALKTPEFIKLKNELSENFKDVAVIVSAIAD